MLRPYQEVGVDKMFADICARGWAWQCDEQGLGKTLQIIETGKRLRAPVILVLCPTIAIISWRKEIEQWHPASIVIADWNKRTYGPKEARQNAKQFAGDSVRLARIGHQLPVYIVMSYGRAIRESAFLQGLVDSGKLLLVLDEHHELKNPESKRGHLVFAPGTGLAAKATATIAASGTPMPAWPQDLFGMMACLYPRAIENPYQSGMYLTSDQFKMHYHQTGLLTVKDKKGRAAILPERKIKDVNQGTIHSFYERIAGLAVRRKKEEVAKDLPPLVMQPKPVEANWKVYRQELADFMEDHETALLLIEDFRERQTAGEVLDEQEVLDALAEIAHMAHVLQITALHKIDQIEDHLVQEIIDDPNRVRIWFFHHQRVRDRLIEVARKSGTSFEVVDGSTSTTKRTRIVDDVQSRRCRLVIGQIKAMGTAITLTAATREDFFETGWSPSDVAQAAARAHRIGQTERVIARLWNLDGSVEQAVAEVIARKVRAVADLTAAIKSPS